MANSPAQARLRIGERVGPLPTRLRGPVPPPPRQLLDLHLHLGLGSGLGWKVGLIPGPLGGLASGRALQQVDTVPGGNLAHRIVRYRHLGPASSGPLPDALRGLRLAQVEVVQRPMQVGRVRRVGHRVVDRPGPCPCRLGTIGGCSVIWLVIRTSGQDEVSGGGRG